MSEKTLKTRIQNKRGTTAEWATGTAPNFVPKDGEIVAYTDVHRIKIGDGTTKVSALPFVDKVRDVTLGGESMVNANGVVELQQTVMTDGCIPVWNNTEKIFIDSRCHNTVDGLQVEGSIGMYSSECTLDVNVQDGSFSYSDDGQNTIKKYALPITKDSGTLAMCYKIPDKHFQPFAVGDDLSGQTLYFNNQANYSQYFLAVYTILTSSGGYSIEVGGPPDITLKKNGTIVATFYTYSNSRWLESYTLPSDFGTIVTLDSKGGSEGLSNSKPSIWYTLGLGPAEDYTNIDVEDVYNDIKTVRSKIPAVIDYLTNSSTTDALSANQGRVLNLNKAPNNHASTATTYGVGELAKYGHVKVINGDLNGKTPQDGYAASQSHTHSQYAPKANPSFTGNATIGGNLTVNGTATFQNEVRVNSSAGTEGQVLTSRGSNKSPIWKTFTASAPSNMVTTDTIQTISGLKYLSGTQVFEGSVQIANGGSGIEIFNTGDSFAVSLVIDESNGLPEDGADVCLPVVDRQLVGSLCLVGAVSNGTKGQVLTSNGVARAATWSTLPAFAMNTALPINYRLSTSSNGAYNSVAYGTASTVNCLMTRDLPDHASLNRHISYCIHLSTTIAAGRWVRFDVPSISYNNMSYYPYIKTITATPIKTSTSSTSPAIITYITNNQVSGSYAYVGCCSQQLNGLDVRIDCIVS